MSLSTYQDFLGAIPEWLAKPNIEDRVPDFITLAEATIARRLKTVVNEIIAVTPLFDDQMFYSIPPRMMEMRNIYIDTVPRNKLVYRTPEQLMTEDPYESRSIYAYTVVDGQIKLNAPSTAGNNLAVSYFERFPPLTEQDNTNWITENAPDLLLYGALVEAEMYVVDDKRVPMWKSKFEEILSSINLREDKSRHSGAALEIRVG